MFRLRYLLATVFLLACCGSAFAQIVKITVDDTIQPISAEYIDRAIAHAQQTNADAVLIDLNTPGGLVDSTRDIIQKILASPVPVIVYVTPTGARAASAGFFILESADVAAMAPGTNTGAAHPVTITGEKIEDTMKTKLENDAAAFMRSFVGPRGRNVPLAESAVRESKSWTDQEALQLNLIDLVAADQIDLLHQLDGRKVKRFDGKEVTLHLAGKTGGRAAYDGATANSRLPARSQHRLSGAGHRRARSLCRVQSSRSRHSRGGRSRVHPAWPCSR